MENAKLSIDVVTVSCPHCGDSHECDSGMLWTRYDIEREAAKPQQCFTCGKAFAIRVPKTVKW